MFSRVRETRKSVIKTLKKRRNCEKGLYIFSFTGMLCAGGGLLPPALLDESRVPKFYLDALVASGGTSSTALPNTGLGKSN